MATELTFTTRGTSDVMAAFNKMKAGQDALAEGATNINEGLKLTSVEAKKLDKLQQEIARRNESAADRYIRKIEETQRALAGHKNETELLKRETLKLNTEYIKAAESGKKLTNEEKAALQQLRTETEKLKTELGLVETATEDAFGSDAVVKIGAVAAGLLAAGTPLALFKKGLEDTKAAIEKAKEAATATAPGAGELRQLADNQAEYDKLEAMAQRLRKSGAVKDLPEAYEATFALAGADFVDEESVRLFEQLGQKQVVGDIGNLAKSTQVYASSFSKAEAGNAKQILAKSFAAAKRSPGSVNEVLEAIAGVGSVASPEGITDEETGAGIATLATSIGTPAEAKTALESFITSTASIEGMEGLSLRERVLKIQAMRLPTAELKELLGRKEAMRGYNNLSLGMESYDRTLREIEAANFNTGAIDEKLAIKAPLADTVTLSRKREALIEEQNLLQGSAQQLVDRMWEAGKQDARRKGRDLFGDNAAGATAGAIGSGTLSALETYIGFRETPMETLRNDLQRLDSGQGGSDFTAAERETARALVKQQAAIDAQLEEMRKQSEYLRTISEKDGAFTGVNQ